MQMWLYVNMLALFYCLWINASSIWTVLGYCSCNISCCYWYRCEERMKKEKRTREGKKEWESKRRKRNTERKEKSSLVSGAVIRYPCRASLAKLIFTAPNCHLTLEKPHIKPHSLCFSSSPEGWVRSGSWSEIHDRAGGCSVGTKHKENCSIRMLKSSQVLHVTVTSEYCMNLQFLEKK